MNVFEVIMPLSPDTKMYVVNGKVMLSQKVGDTTVTKEMAPELAEQMAYEIQVGMNKFVENLRVAAAEARKVPK